jgi:hypothetical protein
VLRFPPGAFRTKKAVPAIGPAEILLQEYYTPSDILLAGLQSNSDAGLLQTGGMLRIFVIQGSDTISNELIKPVLLRIPAQKAIVEGMKVYTRPSHRDSSNWKNTGNAFNGTKPAWDRKTVWPFDMVVYGNELTWDRMPVGAKRSDEGYMMNGFLNKKVVNTGIKKFKIELTKVDSVTMREHVRIRFRHRGYVRARRHVLDTTYQYQYHAGYYESAVPLLNWINCDYFMELTNPVNLYVQTPQFQGLDVAVYLPDENVYLSAEGKRNSYTARKLPPGRSVKIVAFGQLFDGYYFAKTEATTGQQETALLYPVKMTEDEFRAAWKEFSLRTD